jgi:2-polyprenyl-6-methoxyphenol hydroxylase-like FAD-dependent oxidoreductase
VTQPITEQEHYDVVIVGARCAGAATAMLLARRGLRVLALERQPYGSDTLSTHALMRAGVLQLHRWGLLGPLEAAGTPAIRWTSFHYGDDELVVIAARRVDAPAPRRRADARRSMRPVRRLRGRTGPRRRSVCDDSAGCGVVERADGRRRE